MIDTDFDARLAALLAEPAPAPDRAFAERVIARAACDLALRRARRRGLARVARETAALGAVLAAFALLARIPGPTLAGIGDSLPLASPAMLGITLLAMWALVGAREDLAPA
jgi:hypothetical protein